MIPVEGIVKPIGTAIVPPGRLKPLRRHGEVFLIDNFWMWAHSNGKVTIDTDPASVREFKVDLEDELDDEERSKQRALNAQVEAAVAARLSEEAQKIAAELRQRDERIAKLEAELAARAAKPAVSEPSDVEPAKADDAETKKSRK